MKDIILGSLLIDKEFITNTKLLFKSLFLNKMSNVIVFEDSFFVTNINLADLNTHTFTSSDVFHLVDVLNDTYKKTINQLLFLNSDERFTYLSRDKFITFLGHLEKVTNYYNKKSLSIINDFSITFRRRVNGEVHISLSKEFIQFVDLVLAIEEQEIKTYNNDVEKTIIENFPKNIIASFHILHGMHNSHKKLKKVMIGETTSKQVINSILGTYIDHIQHNTNTIKESINRSIDDLKSLSMYKFIPSKRINEQFENKKNLTLAIPIIPGINHPVPHLKVMEYKLFMHLWKEDETIRHLIEFICDDFKIISFLPNSTFFLLEGEL